MNRFEEPEPSSVEPPEMAVTCFECHRVTAFEIDECVHCGSRLVVTEADIVRVRAINSGRPGTLPKKRRR